MAPNAHKRCRFLIAAVSLLVCLFAVVPRFSSAEEVVHNFSLGFGSLSLAPLDTKAPEPGIVTARYGFRIAKDFIPYMGTGLAYSYQPEVKPGDNLKVKAGMAGQFGFRYLLGPRSTLNLDYKYLYITPEQIHSDSKNPPQSLGIGLDIHF
ncbi:MAG TPA: outer membrane beta-barrel protein [Desulfuromonadales bacterium]|nr:outer membrane beta-barrel protein [Desulfuromonadales bacterium]